MNAPSASAPSDLVSGPCNRIVIYCRDVEAMVSFYSTYFGFQVVARPDDRITELRRADGGLILMLHPASKGQKEGQALIKLVFDVRDVVAFRAHLLAAGLTVGPVHEADNYQFANLKDPAKNSVSISSRAFCTG